MKKNVCVSADLAKECLTAFDIDPIQGLLAAWSLRNCYLEMIALESYRVNTSDLKLQKINKADPNDKLSKHLKHKKHQGLKEWSKQEDKRN